MSEVAERFFEKALDAIKRRDYDRALGLLVETIKHKPNHSEAWVVRGNVLHALDRPFDALLHYDRALGCDETKHDAWNNRGLAFADIGMWKAAEQSFERSAELMPALEPHIGLANMFCTLMKLPEAANEYRAAIKIDPGCIDAHFNLGVTLLGMGQWLEGFKEYETRWLNTPYPPRAQRDYVKWKGEDLSGKTVLLYPEQGYGDEIMALRYVIDLAVRYPTAFIIALARTPMLRLVQNIAKVYDNVKVCPLHSDERWQADYSCPLLDVPMARGEGPADIYRPQKYLRAPDRAVVESWRDWLPKDRVNVGLCWSSGTHLNTAQAAQKAKSIPLAWLKPLMQDGAHFVSLQKPAEPIPPDMAINDGAIVQSHDFADTAALIEALDLVISVDTAVAHLAGSLGKPVWNFVRFSGYWPWLAPDVAANSEYALWYPTMRLLRQPSLANWAEPIERASAWLGQEIAQRKAT